MRARFTIFIIVAILIMGSMTCVYGANNTAIDTTSQGDLIAIDKILASVDDLERIAEIVNLLGTIAYYEMGCDENSKVSNLESNSIDIVDLVGYLSTLTDNTLKTKLRFLLKK